MDGALRTARDVGSVSTDAGGHMLRPSDLADLKSGCKIH